MRINKITFFIILIPLFFLIVYVEATEQKTDNEKNQAVQKKSSILEQYTEVNKLARQLSDDNWEIREKATQILIQMGKSIMPQLENIYNSTKDIETKTRIEKIADKYGYILDSTLREEVSKWSKQLYAPNPMKRIETFDKLVKLGEKGVNILKLIVEAPTPNIQSVFVPSKFTIHTDEKALAKKIFKNTGDKPIMVITSSAFTYNTYKVSNLFGVAFNGASNRLGASSGDGVPAWSDKLNQLCALIYSAKLLNPDESIINDCYFQERIPGIYEYSSYQRQRSLTVNINNISITPTNLILNIETKAVICVLPTKENMGKNMKAILGQPVFKVNEPVELKCIFLDELKLDKENSAFALWYILLDDKMEPAGYGGLRIDKTTIPPVLYKKGQEVKASFQTELIPGNYQLLVGYGDSMFSKMEKIKIVSDK